MKNIWRIAHRKERKYRRCQLLVGLGSLFGGLLLPHLALANDLQIEDYSFVIKKNDIAVTSSQLGYLNSSDKITADISLATSWQCEMNMKTGGCLSPPDFNAVIQVTATPDGYPAICSGNLKCLQTAVKKFSLPAVAVDGATEVRDRPHFLPLSLDTTAVKNFTLELSTAPGFNAFVSQWYNEQYSGQPYSFGLRLEIDSDSEVAETDTGGETNNVQAQSTVDFIPLTGELAFGPTHTALSQLSGTAEDSGTCGSDSGASGTLSNLQLEGGTAAWDPSSAAGWNSMEVALSPAPFCVSFKINTSGDGFDLTALSTVETGPVEGTLGSHQVSIDGNTLDHTDGASPGSLSVPLPHPVSYHEEDPFEPGPAPLGTDTIRITSVAPGDPDDYATLTGQLSGGYLHAEGLPFSLKLSEMTIASSGITGEYSGVHYVHDRSYSSEDERQLTDKGPVSNDRRFSLLAAVQDDTDTSFQITDKGLDVTNIEFSTIAEGFTHFPRTTVSWEGKSTVAVFESRLQESSALNELFPAGPSPVGHYSMDVSTDCAGCVEVDGGSTLDYNLNSLVEGLAADGAVMSRVNGLTDPYWGPDTADGHIFQRPGDSGTEGILYFPGGIALGTGGTEEAAVSEYLLGMRRAAEILNDSEPKVLLPAEQYALTHNTSRRGSYFMAGLTVGPELYRDPVNGQPDIGLGATLEDTTMTIGFGNPSPDFQTMESAAATKYVVRQGGVTGAFNFATVPQPTLYNYPFALTRFAFRQINNIPDDFTWMDGTVSIPGRGGFDIAFESMELECSGDVGKGLVAWEARPGELECADGTDNNGNGFTDENCNERLSAWNAAIDLLSIGFVPDNPDLPVCAAQERSLRVGNSVYLKALNGPLGMRANWSAAGDPSAAEISGSTDQILDQPKDGDGNPLPETDENGDPVPDKYKPGFNVALNTDISLKWLERSTTDEGWFAMDSTVAAPFWNSLDTSMRVANSDVDTPDQTIVIARGASVTEDGSDDTQSNSELQETISGTERGADSPAWDTAARYDWGSTGFSFELPVFYAMGRVQEQESPRFLGRTLSTDLVVLAANAGVDWIAPDNTKVSFGASADFQALEELEVDLSIDLTDPESVAKLDNFLQGLGIVGDSEPVSDLVSEIRDRLSLMNLVLGAGLDNFLELGIDAALAGLSSDFDEAAAALGAVQSIPEQLASQVSDGLQELTEAVITPLSPALDSAMVEAYQELPGLYLSAAAGSPDTGKLEQYEERFSQAVRAMDNVWAQLNTVQEAVEQTKSNVADLSGQITGSGRGSAGEAVAALNNLQNVLGTVGTVATFTSCDFTTASFTDPAEDPAEEPENSNPILEKIHEVLVRVHQVRNVLQGIRENNSLISFAAQLGSATGIDLSALQNAQESLNSLIEDLLPPIDQAFAHLDGLCDGERATEMSEVLGEVDALIGRLIDTMKLIRGEPGVAPGLMMEAQTAVADELDNAGRLIREALGQVSHITTYLSAHKGRIVHAQTGFADSSFLYNGLSEAEIRERLNADIGDYYDWFYAGSGTSGHSFVQELRNTLRDPIDNAIALAVREADRVLEDAPLDEVPHPSGEELRNQIKDLIMNSDAVASIDSAVNEALGEVFTGLNDAGLDILDQLNLVIQGLFEQLENEANEVLQAATGEISNDIPLKAAKIDGYAVIGGDELERLHIGAEWTMDGDDEESTTEYAAALDVTSWSTNNKGLNCLGDADITGMLDAEISVCGVPISIGGSDLTVEKLSLGFTIKDQAPMGLFGGIKLDGELDFQAFSLYDIGFAAGVGQYENYLGATAAATFDDIQMEAAFLVGKTCNTEVLRALDPQVAEFITFPGGVFNGVYVRGAASFPIWTNGCMLDVGISADAGAWLLAGPPVTVGGLVGGGAYGEAACIVSLRGQVIVYGELSGDTWMFGGEGFGGAGIGSCEPNEWTSVSKIRADSWCATGDASFGAKYQDGWELYNMETSGID